MASRKPLVWGVEPGDAPSKCLRIMPATFFIGHLGAHHVGAPAFDGGDHIDLLSIEFTVFRDRARRGGALCRDLHDESIESARWLSDRRRRSLSSAQRKPLRLGSVFCSRRRVLITAVEA